MALQTENALSGSQPEPQPKPQPDVVIPETTTDATRQLLASLEKPDSTTNFFTLQKAVSQFGFELTLKHPAQTHGDFMLMLLYPENLSGGRRSEHNFCKSAKEAMSKAHQWVVKQLREDLGFDQTAQSEQIVA